MFTTYRITIRCVLRSTILHWGHYHRILLLAWKHSETEVEICWDYLRIPPSSAITGGLYPLEGGSRLWIWNGTPYACCTAFFPSRSLKFLSHFLNNFAEQASSIRSTKARSTITRGNRFIIAIQNAKGRNLCFVLSTIHWTRPALYFRTALQLNKCTQPI